MSRGSTAESEANRRVWSAPAPSGADAARRSGSAFELERVVRALPVGFYACDADGRVTLYNEAAAALWGRTPVLGEELWSGSFRMYRTDGSPLPLERGPMALALADDGDDVQGAEAVIERADGTRRDVLVYPQVFRDPAGNVTGAINVMVDVTERKAERAELAATKDDLALQVDALTRLHELAMRLAGMEELEPALEAVLQTLVSIHNADFGLLSLYDPTSNALCAAASVGFAPNLLRQVARVYPNRDVGACGHAFANQSRTIIDDCASDPRFAAYRDFAAKVGFRAVHSTPILTRAGAVLGVLSVHFAAPRRPTAREVQFADMCARYAAETIELIRNQSALREADRRKDVFIATLAHELRNPLTPIRNAMHVIRLSGDNPAAVAQTRQLIERQLAQLVRLVDDLLDVSRISRGKIELRRETVELQAVLRQSIETSSALVDHYDQTLEVALPIVPVHVHGDPTRLAQVFWNLINNAAKYTNPGGRLRVMLSADEKGATVAVRDNGIGLPPEMREQIFEMFTQVDTSLDKSRGGLGVGLAIVQRLVQMHGGTVEARSEGVGKGSEFVVWLPRADADEDDAAIAVPELPAMRRAEGRPRARRILVVDDNVDLAQSLAKMLQLLGHDVQVLHDGRSAIDKVQQFAPDLVFLDIGMPGMNGYETCRRIRVAPHGEEAVIVALSGWGQEEDKQRSKEAGFDLHLVKPFDPALLEAMLAKVDGRLAARQVAADAAAQEAAVVEDAGVEPRLAITAPSLLDEPPASAEAALEAARYALFRRILPVLRHGLVGELQGVQFAVSLAKRNCEKRSAPDSAIADMERIAEQAQAAVGRGTALTGWLRPEPAAQTTVGEALAACLDLVGTEWSVRGIEVTSSVPAASLVVAAAPIREVLAAMLVTLGDTLPGPADVTLGARKRVNEVVVSLRARPSTRDGEGRVSLYRDLRWSDVNSLARAHGIAWSRRGNHVIARFPVTGPARRV